MTHRGGSIRWGRFGAAALPLMTALAVTFGAPGAAAQDATPATGDEGRPGHIHSGSCGEGELGDVVQALANLTEPDGESEGNEAAAVAESSVTNVPLALEDILAEDHAINLHLSTEEIETYIACGEIGGPIREDGSLTIGLKQQNDSGFTGIAVLAPGEDGESTDVSVFIAPVIDAEVGGGAEEDEATPMAEAGGEAVDVTLTEWAIEMPDTLAAGPTTFTLINDGEFPHTIEIEGEGVEEEADVVEPGDEGTFELDLEAGTYTVYCPVGGGSHREQGMEIEVTVE